MRFSTHIEENKKELYQLLPLKESFDFITRDICFGENAVFFIGINGLCNTTVLQQIISDLQSPLYRQEAIISDLQQFVKDKLGFSQVTLTDHFETVISNVLSGPIALIVDGFSQAVLIDARSYPVRGIQEPDMERISRGARDGFVETMLFNTNLIRRRIRSPKLTFTLRKVGTESSTDIAIAYLKSCVNTEVLKHLLDLLDKLQVTSLTMGSKSLEELLIAKRWWNPLPCIQMTERPDVACSYLMEGHIIVIADNSPTVLILPCTLFQFTQSPDDYYKSPIVGGYYRLLRFACIPVNLLTLPLFLMITANFPALTEKWRLLTDASLSRGRIFFYLLAVDLAIDLLKYSAALTSSRYSGSLSIVGGLLIGDIAVQLNWASIEVLFYAGITLLSGLALSSPEFADALRLYRLFLLLCTGLMGIWGFCIGFALILLSTATTPTFGKMSYLWPLYPYNRKALHNLLFRAPTPQAQPPSIWYRGKIK